MGSIVKVWPGFITPTALFSVRNQKAPAMKKPFNFTLVVTAIVQYG